MNIESRVEGDPIEGEPVGDARRRRRVIVAAAAAVLLVVVIGYILSHRHGAAKPTADAAPNVTVIVPGRHDVSASISATGNVGARRDMPIGAVGEGGVVTRVLVEAGDWVRPGQVLATIDRSVQTQQAAALSAAINQSRADAALAKSNLDRARKLVTNGFVSKADIDTKQAALDSANARVAVAQAQLAQQHAMIGRLDLRAPAGGLVLTRSIEAGQVVGGNGATLFRVAMNGAMEVQARLAEDDLARIHVGSPATVTPVGTTLKISGSVWQLSPVIDPSTRQGIVRVALPFDKALRPGGFASVAIGGGKADVPLLPESAVLSDQKGNFVYIVGNDDKVARRDVKVGEVDDRGVSIVTGLSGREHVVASAGAFLNPGDKIIPMLALRGS